MALQRMLISASVIATKQGIEAAIPDEVLEYKQMLKTICCLEQVHQLLVWKIYWEGLSLRGLAAEWEIDELNVIREHKQIIDYMLKAFGKGVETKIPRVRPGLREVAARIRRDNIQIAFSQLLKEGC